MNTRPYAVEATAAGGTTIHLTDGRTIHTTPLSYHDKHRIFEHDYLHVEHEPAGIIEVVQVSHITSIR